MIFEVQKSVADNVWFLRCEQTDIQTRLSKYFASLPEAK